MTDAFQSLADELHVLRAQIAVQKADLAPLEEREKELREMIANGMADNDLKTVRGQHLTLSLATTQRRDTSVTGP